jgi:hypothetical protein
VWGLNRKKEIGGAYSANGEGKGVYRVLVVMPEEKRLLVRPRIILRRVFRK